MSKKGENIYKRKDGRWEARYIKAYRPDGTARFGYCYGKTYKEAKAKQTEARSAILSGKSIPPAVGKRVFSYYCDEWMILNRDRVKESTYVKYSGIMEKHIKPNLGGRLDQTLSSTLIEEFSHELLVTDKLSAKTVKDILTMLHSVLKYTVKQYPGYLSEIDIVYPKIPKKEMRVLTMEEQKRFVEYLLNDTDECKFGVLLALFTGMRIGEVCALRWNSISLSERTIRVSTTMQRLKKLDNDENTDEQQSKTKIMISDPKSNFSARIIPLTENAFKLCSEQYCGNPSAYVLTGDSTRFIEPRTMQYRLKRYTDDCGLEGVHFHILRHTFATRCVEVDFEIKSLSEILGHSSPRITLERYVHSSMELKRNNMDKLSAIGF